MNGRLSLIYPGGSVALLEADAPPRLIDKIRGLGVGQQLELRIRAPVVLEELVDELGSLGELADTELQQRLAEARRQVRRLEHEQDRRVVERDICPDCRMHRRYGHAAGCPRVAAGGSPQPRLPLTE